ncbi:DinB family protein [Sediminibacterium ginsengisoli]|nr:DinB family protein [Sediminibacterium ginsengisoli]
MQQLLISQYGAALQMLKNAIEVCPEELWTANDLSHAFWKIAYHALHFTNFYLSENEHSFSPWPLHEPGNHQLQQKEGRVYSHEELLQLLQQTEQSLKTKLSLQDMRASSGFEWLPMNKAELHLYNIRHLQHHVGQLVERLHYAGITGIRWVGRQELH